MDQPRSESAKDGRKEVINLPTVEAYNMWAKTYDHDGNVLQKIDDIVLEHIIPTVLRKEGHHAEDTTSLRIMDLGCGTGRNTIKILPFAANLVAVDNSEGMMAVAKERVSCLLNARARGEDFAPPVEWIIHDINEHDPEHLLSQINMQDRMDVVISTLVLEHLQMDPFFSTVTKVLRPGGVLIMTNMHPEMGSISQAGFNDTERGVKIRPVSYNHSIKDILECAEKQGFHLQGDVVETGVKDLKHAEVLGHRAQKWIGINIHLAMVFQYSPPEHKVISS